MSNLPPLWYSKEQLKCQTCYRNCSFLKDSLNLQNYCSDSRHRLCKRCGKQFESQMALFLHVRLHGREKHECSQCYSLYQSPEELEVHKSYHEWQLATGEVKCKVCCKKFGSKQELEWHLFKARPNVKLLDLKKCIDVEFLSGHTSGSTSDTNLEEEAIKEVYNAVFTDIGNVPGTSSYQAEIGNVPGTSSYQAEIGNVPGTSSYQAEIGNVPGTSSYQAEIGNVPGTSSYQAEIGNVPGTSSYQAEIGNVPGTSIKPR